MALNPFNPNEAYRASQERWKRAAERPYAREVYRILQRASKEAEQAVRDGLDPFSGPYLIGGGLEAELAYVLNKRNRMVATQWGQIVARSAKSHMGLERKDFATDFSLWLDRWIAAHIAAKVTRISDTTRDQIRDSIAIGLREELGPRQVARLIQERTRTIGRSRAMTIATTEVNGASNAATVEAANALDITTRRQWIAASDRRTRTSHEIANGQIRADGEAFDVGGAKLMQPGDPSGPPEEIIRCRCGVGLVLVD